MTGPSPFAPSQKPDLPSRAGESSAAEAQAERFAVAWIKDAVRWLIADLHASIPCWGVLPPGTAVGTFAAGNAYLVLLFDADGGPHVRRFPLRQLERLPATSRSIEGKLRRTIESIAKRQLPRPPSSTPAFGL